MRTHQELVHPSDQILATMERVYRYRMTTTSGGNISIKDGNGDVWITPARVDKGALRREDIVCVHPDGTITGMHRPSSELPFHLEAYRTRPDINAILHAHPVSLVAFSIGGNVPDTRLIHQARSVCGDVGFAPYALPGSVALGSCVAAKFGEGFNCVVLENHGVVVGGQSLGQAFQRFETLEFTAKTIIKGRQLGPVSYLTEEQVALPREKALPLPQFAPAAPTSQELDLRRKLCDFVHRGYRQRLLISTEGSFSARLGDDCFLVTPYQMDRSTIDLEDIVLVQNGAAEKGKTASRSSHVHRNIYLQHPEIGAIVGAYTVNATAFSVTCEPFETRTIPESYIFLRDVARIPYGLQFGSGEKVAQIVSIENPIALLQNDGVLVCGRTVLDAFDRLEVLESTAEALVNSRPLGQVSPMADGVIEELKAAFLQKPI